MIDPDLVHRLARFRSDDAPVLSVYVGIPPDPGQLRSVESRFHSLLKGVRPLGDADDLDHDSKQSLRADIDKVLAAAAHGTEFLGRGVAIFACFRHGLYEQVVMPRSVRDRALVDATPYIRPLLAVLDETHRYCVVVVGREKAWLYEYYLGRLEEEAKLRGRALRKPNFGGCGGYEERTVKNTAEVLARRHFRKTAEGVEELMSATGAELLVIGGHQETVAAFEPFLPRPLQAKVAGTIVVDPNAMTPGQVRERAEDVIANYEREEERRLVAATLDRVRAGGFAAAGVDWCLTATNERAVQLLLVHDDEQVPGRVCDTCGWLGLDGDECPLDGQQTRKTGDVIDEMAAAVIDMSGSVEHVRPGPACRRRRPPVPGATRLRGHVMCVDPPNEWIGR